MVRPVGPFDILLLNRLQNQGVQLDPRRALTQPESPLAVVLRAPLALHQPAAYTCIARPQDDRTPAGFVQLRRRQPGRPDADVTYIAPQPISDPNVCELWARLLEFVSWEAALSGVQRVFASLPADAEELVPFLNAGFVIFAREELFTCERLPRLTDAPAIALRPQRPSDAWGLQRLYAGLVPLGVRQAEGLSGGNGADESIPDWMERGRREAYVWEQEGDIVGHLELTRGKIGHWAHFTLHPDRADLAGAFVDAGLYLLRAEAGRPVCAPVRTYESWMKPALLARGFRLLGRRDLAVRQTLARVKEPATVAVRALEHQRGVTATPTVVRAEYAEHNGGERLEPAPVARAPNSCEGGL